MIPFRILFSPSTRESSFHFPFPFQLTVVPNHWSARPAFMGVLTPHHRPFCPLAQSPDSRWQAYSPKIRSSSTISISPTPRYRSTPCSTSSNVTARCRMLGLFGLTHTETAGQFNIVSSSYSSKGRDVNRSGFESIGEETNAGVSLTLPSTAERRQRMTE